MYKEDHTLTRSVTVAQISMDAYHQLWHHQKARLDWNCLFVLPFWLDTVCRHLGALGEPTILTVHDGADLIGLVPLAVADQRAFFLGNPDVCDYQDIVAAPGKGTLVMHAAIHHLARRNIQQLDLRTLRPDAVALTALESITTRQDLQVQRIEDDVTYEIALPENWDVFLMQLNSKQRHEVRRKLRRLASRGNFTYRMASCDTAVIDAADAFIQLFQMNRSDKAAFMNPAMATYFKALIQRLAQQQMLRLYFLDIDNQPSATVLCFDYGQVRYLYNSGYDAQYHDLSVGILSKILSIQAGIEAGCHTYDFLKGAEVYKKRTGGQQVPLYQCQVML